MPDQNTPGGAIPASPETVEQRTQAQAELYGRYVAKSVIYINGARAFNPGDPVPASHIGDVVSKSDVDPKKG